MAYKGGKREKATLLYEKEIYTPEGAKNLSEKDLKKEYTRLRSIARKRLQRFEGTEWTDTQIYQLNVGTYKPMKEIKSDRELRHLFTSVARFVDAKISSVSALEKQRKQTIKTFNERGYDFVKKDNYKQFINFMEYARVANMGRMYDSKRDADFYEMTETKNLSNEELRDAFRKWSKKEREQSRIRNKNPRTSSQYRKDLGD